ncbi:hypothetical protein H6G91_21565 [Nostoc muscorum FACHB-395]|nr:hypothetical protein [Desmonostoc muscorum FACHB-395]
MSRSPVEYNGYSIVIEQSLKPDRMTGDHYWMFRVYLIGKHLSLVGKQISPIIKKDKYYPGFEVALSEAINSIDDINKNVV